MPDVVLVVRGLAEAGEPDRLERALERLGFVRDVNVDSAKELVAVSYDGGEEELGKIEESIQEAGYEYEPSPGARNAGG